MHRGAKTFKFRQSCSEYSNPGPGRPSINVDRLLDSCVFCGHMGLICTHEIGGKKKNVSASYLICAHLMLLCPARTKKDNNFHLSQVKQDQTLCLSSLIHSFSSSINGANNNKQTITRKVSHRGSLSKAQAQSPPGTGSGPWQRGH